MCRRTRLEHITLATSAPAPVFVLETFFPVFLHSSGEAHPLRVRERWLGRSFDAVHVFAIVAFYGVVDQGRAGVV